LKEDGLKEKDTLFVVIYKETREGNRGEQGWTLSLASNFGK
jgi:hypothetical protein